jgi:hypothetical protein
MGRTCGRGPQQMVVGTCRARHLGVRDSGVVSHHRHRLKLEGSARWGGIELLEVSSAGLLIEAPADPPLAIGTIRDLEIDGLRGRAICETSYPHPDPAKAFYSIAVIEFDEGLLAAIERRASHRGGKLRISLPDAGGGR